MQGETQKRKRARESFGWSGTGIAEEVGSEQQVPQDAVEAERSRMLVCPRCGQGMFADMDVCYGCLYDFTRDHTPHLLPQVPGAALPLVPAPALGDSPGAEPPPPLAPANAPSRPRFLLADDLDEPATLDVAVLPTSPPGKPTVAVAGATCVLVRTGDMDVTVEVPETGLHVGRSPANDVVLHAKSVSREHALLVPGDGGVIVRDLGSTNPPLFRGRPIEGSRLVPFGSFFLLCGSHFEPLLR